MDKQWKVAGTYFEACNCEAACPCNFKGAPTEGSCTVLVAWHIDQGTFGSTQLNDLNTVLAAHSPGHMLDGNWKVALYLDERADGPQQEALHDIFSGAAGGHLAALTPLIGQVLGMRTAKIEYRSDGRKRSLQLENVGSADIEAIAGLDGGEVTIVNPPFTVAPGVPLVASRSSAVRYNDHGLTLDVAGRNGYYSPFSYQSD
jgi:hypothetical protein